MRPSNQFIVEPLDPIYLPATRGAHASSWSRFEDGKAVLVALRIQRLDGGPGRNTYKDILSTTASVVVAFKTEDAFEHATKLAVVPFGNGQLTLRRAVSSAASAQITEHYFPSQSVTKHVELNAGKLQIRLRQANDQGSLLEWIEIEIRPALKRRRM